MSTYSSLARATHSSLTIGTATKPAVWLLIVRGSPFRRCAGIIKHVAAGLWLTVLLSTFACESAEKQPPPGQEVRGVIEEIVLSMSVQGPRRRIEFTRRKPSEGWLRKPKGGWIVTVYDIGSGAVEERCPATSAQLDAFRHALVTRARAPMLTEEDMQWIRTAGAKDRFVMRMHLDMTEGEYTEMKMMQPAGQGDSVFAERNDGVWFRTDAAPVTLLALHCPPRKQGNRLEVVH